MRFFRGWLEAKGQGIQSLALVNNIKVSSEFIQLTFRANEKSTELAAIAIARDYSIEYDSSSIELLECKPAKRFATLKDSSGNSKFKLKTASISESIAYYLNDESKGNSEGTGIEIVERKKDVVEDDQIAISKDGQIYVSTNLSGKTIKVRAKIIYPRRVTILTSPLLSVKAHLVGIDEDKIMYYAFTGQPQSTGSVSPKNHLRNIKLQILDKIELELINVAKA